MSHSDISEISTQPGSVCVSVVSNVDGLTVPQIHRWVVYSDDDLDQSLVRLNAALNALGRESVSETAWGAVKSACTEHFSEP